MHATPLWNPKAAVGILLAALLVASSVRANTNSDYNDGADAYTDVAAGGVTTRTYDSAGDWCSAVDNDGPGGDSPTGDEDSCDNNSTGTVVTVAGPGDPTGLVGLFAANCQNNGATTVCDNGFFMRADTASGDGRYGGDYPEATQLVISSDPPARFVLQTEYRDTATGVMEFTGITLSVCVGNGANGALPFTIWIGGGGLADPPSGKSIDGVFGGRLINNALCPNGGVANPTTPTVTGAWTYASPVDDSTVSAHLDLVDNGDGTCTATFDNSGSVAFTRWGRVDSQVMVGPSNEYGNFQSSEAQGASLNAVGAVIVPIRRGEAVTNTVSAWAIGAKYKVAFDTAICLLDEFFTCEPTDLQTALEPPFDPLALTDVDNVTQLAIELSSPYDPTPLCAAGETPQPVDADASMQPPQPYFYAGAYSYPAAGRRDGGGVTTWVENPAISTESGTHSLFEISVQGTDTTDIVEIGWTKDKSTNDVRLFVFSWVNGVAGCYNKCGWVQSHKSIVPGMKLATGTQSYMGYVYYQGNWWGWFQNQWVGYYPGTRWSGGFTSTGLVQWFGEVYESDATPESDMGKGLLASNANAAKFWGPCEVDAARWVCVIKGSPSLNQPNPTYYSVQSAGNNNWRYGGPGAG